jgi:aryl-alcohol dehydrogenase-like predicted oxidoreductase
LQRLGGDHIDLYQFHLFDQGGFYFGALDLHAWQLMRAIGSRRAKGRSTLVSIQNYLLNRDE